MTLDELVHKGELPTPDYIKIDVEGAELLVLTGGRQMLSRYHPTSFLATHGCEIHSRCCQLLESLGYALRAIGRSNVNEADEIVAYGWNG